MNGDIIQTLVRYFQFPFVVYAVITGVVIALTSSLLGVTLVLKRLSFIGDGLSHVAFGAIAIATVFDVSNDMLVVMPVTVLSAILLLYNSKNRIIRGDAALAMISVGALALGYLAMNVFNTSANLAGDVCTTLFGSTSILTLTITEVLLSVILSAVVVGIFTFFYHKIFAVTFDESFSAATGIKTGIYDTMIAVIIAVIIVLAMKLVGSLLTSALIVFPALSAMRLFRSYRQVIVCSAVVSVVCAFSGIVLSILVSTPVGSTIVAVNIAVFLIFSLIALIRKGIA